jgi:hypothetical protein
MSEQFPITLTIPLDFNDGEGHSFRVEYDREKNLILQRVVDGRLMVVRECTLDEAREWFARKTGDSK